MTPFLRERSTRHPLFVLTLAVLVHAAAAMRDAGAAETDRKTAPQSAPAQTTPPAATAAPTSNGALAPAVPALEPARKPVPLPQPAAEMREAILTAVHAGSIDELRIPLEWNEMKPDVAPGHVDDPVAYWRQISGDGEGREILAVLGRILELPHAVEPLGKDFENNRVFVWPYLALADLSKLTPAQEVELYRLVSPAEAKVMRERKKWTWWRLSIGADGTWHSFVRE